MTNKPLIISFGIGLLLGVLIMSVFLQPKQIQLILEIIQTLAITLATIFTAWWTSKTFGYDLKSKEAKEITNILHQMRECIPNIIHPVVPLVSMDILDIKKLALDWEKEREKVSKHNWYKFQELKKSLEQTVTISGTLKVNTRLKLLRIGNHITRELIKADEENKLYTDIITLQVTIIQEANFDIGIEMIKLKKFFGF